MVKALYFLSMKKCQLNSFGMNFEKETTKNSGGKNEQIHRYNKRKCTGIN